MLNFYGVPSEDQTHYKVVIVNQASLINHYPMRRLPGGTM